MARLIPYLLSFGLGFVASALLFKRSDSSSDSESWKSKYWELHERFRDLTRRLSDLDQQTEVRVGRLRQALRNVQEALENSDGQSSAAVAKALEEIEITLNER